MRHLTDTMLTDAINQVGDRFDCHEVQRRLLRDHAVATANEIIAQAGSGDPLRYFSAVLSKYIDTAFRLQLRKLDKISTANLGGKMSKNQEWEKVSGFVTTPSEPPTIESLLAELTDEDLEQ